MGRLVISTNSSLDGVVQDPDGKEGFALGGWFTRCDSVDLAAWAEIAYDEALHTDALLVGRNTDAWFAARWNERPGGWAERLNGLPKYVVSSTPDEPRWRNATVLTGDVADEVTRLKASIEGDLVVYASYQLSRTLLAHDLVDELRLFVFPVLVGGGRRLFGEAGDPRMLRLTAGRTVGRSLTLLTYAPVAR